jgi:hypothetical protein
MARLRKDVRGEVVEDEAVEDEAQFEKSQRNEAGRKSIENSPCYR